MFACLYFPFPCVYREEDTPSSIPNLAVKLLFADDTALCKCGNVGRCRDWGNIYLTYKILLYLLFIVFYLTLPYFLSRLALFFTLLYFTFYLTLPYSLSYLVLFFYLSLLFILPYIVFLDCKNLLI